MTCKDCIHESVCVIIAFPEAFENTKWERGNCDHFKNKADYVEVVRCKDCEHCKILTDQFDNDLHFCSLDYNAEVPADGFCGYGEKRTCGTDTNVGGK